MSGNRTALLISNRRADDPGGRAAKVETRGRLLPDHGWEVAVGHVPEPYLASFPVSFARCVRRGRAVDADAVVSLCNPFHLHLVGYLVSRALGVPWIAEYRDPILPRPDLDRGSLRWYPAALVERLTATKADRVLWYDGIQMADDYFETTYPSVPADRFVKLPPMGYERQAFDAATPRSYGTTTITYAGSFYDGWIEPYGFLGGFGTYLDEASDEVRAQFYGDWNEDYQRAAAEAGVADAVDHHEFVPHEEIVPVLNGSDLLLYIGGSDPKNARNLPSKIYDYLGAGTPILALVDPEFRVAKFVGDNGLGVVAPPDDPEAIGAALRTVLDGEFAYDPDPDLFDEYSRERSASRIARELDAVVADTTSS